MGLRGPECQISYIQEEEKEMTNWIRRLLNIGPSKAEREEAQREAKALAELRVAEIEALEKSQTEAKSALEKKIAQAEAEATEAFFSDWVLTKSIAPAGKQITSSPERVERAMSLAAAALKRRREGKLTSADTAKGTGGLYSHLLHPKPKRVRNRKKKGKPE
jgi:multidrug resistance efflux pump